EILIDYKVRYNFFMLKLLIMLSEQISFLDLPKQYEIAIAQYILFTLPIQKTFKIAGGGPLDFAAWFNLDEFTPTKLKDIDLTFKTVPNQPKSYYEDEI